MTASPAPRALVLLARLRFVLAVAGVAWLLGYSPSIGGRIVAAVVVALTLGLDLVANSAGETGARPTFGTKSPTGGAA
ncbi:hypothetical protein ACFWOJ_38790 [Streptomyces sp. NPDC058439]|uniref:hypothetical protein n=1 Tax=Streptomyces sp. NPDC058439 TaxID=3346500 RepID=UPI003656B816